jgi:hypothetical protein
VCVSMHCSLCVLVHHCLCVNVVCCLNVLYESMFVAAGALIACIGDRVSITRSSDTLYEGWSEDTEERTHPSSLKNQGSLSTHPC